MYILIYAALKMNVIERKESRNLPDLFEEALDNNTLSQVFLIKLLSVVKTSLSIGNMGCFQDLTLFRDQLEQQEIFYLLSVFMK